MSNGTTRYKTGQAGQLVVIRPDMKPLGSRRHRGGPPAPPALPPLVRLRCWQLPTTRFTPSVISIQAEDRNCVMAAEVQRPTLGVWYVPSSRQMRKSSVRSVTHTYTVRRPAQ
jgi:hypothetical protein